MNWHHFSWHHFSRLLAQPARACLAASAAPASGCCRGKGLAALAVRRIAPLSERPPPGATTVRRAMCPPSPAPSPGPSGRAGGMARRGHLLM